MREKLLFLLVGVIAFFSFQSTSYAQSRFTALLNAAQESPASNVMGKPTGTAVFTLRGNATDGFELKYDITVTGLSGSITMAHFHQQVPGMPGDVVKGITSSFNGNTASGVWRSTDQAQPLTPALVEAVQSGEIYVDIHTDTNTAGEIRGQIYPTLMFVARLDTAQEVPVPVVSGTPAGTAHLTLRGASNGGVELSFDITIDGLSGPITLAHFHRGMTGVAGGVVRSIQDEFGDTNTASGVWRSMVQSQPLTPDLVKALLNGEIYINIHTAANRTGEIRGQVVPE
ncbi:MAG: CHRD domain-containing protein [Acidobacteria bacterium]|nr:CHRD domain-containing protein [Acidobacteriota bacterium]